MRVVGLGVGLKSIENTVCTVEKTLHLWNEPINMETQHMCVCVLTLPSCRSESEQASMKA